MPLHQSAQVKTDIENLIGSTMRDTFEGMFGWRLQSCAHANRPIPAPVHSLARLREAEAPVEVSVRLDFDPQLLSLAGAHIYPDHIRNSPDMFADMAAEIANILAGSLKTYLNRQGLTLMQASTAAVMHVPQAASPPLVDTAFEYDDGRTPRPLGIVVRIDVQEAASAA